jgi:4'-phosphopantetheinyl transferase
MDSQPPLDPPLLFDWGPRDHWLELKPDETHVLRVELGDKGDADEPSLLTGWTVLSEEERARALRLVRGRDRRRFVVCRGALRMILGRILQIPPETVHFHSGPGGKPVLAAAQGTNLPFPLQFNVTHSGDLALIAVNLHRELGIDLERIRTISEAARIVESYFTPAERAQFAALDEPSRVTAFLRGWTRKEAILKAKGVGLAGLATGYQTMFGTTALDTRFTPAWPLPQVQEWSLWEASPHEGYVAALAIQVL